MNFYRVEQNCGGNWEPVPEGDFETSETAVAAMRNLETDLGWSGLRVVEMQEVGRYQTVIGVVENGA